MAENGSAKNGTAALPLLKMRGITKVFPGVRALDGVDFTLRSGEIHALMGENGAGKSTLIKVLTGAYRPDGGTIELKGAKIAPRSVLEAQRHGISAVFQEVNLVPDLSLAENIYLGREPVKAGRINWRAVLAGARAAMLKLDVDADVTLPLKSFSIAIQQLTAIARALDVQASVLVLDEPTSSLAAHEVQKLFEVMRKLREQGLGIVFITHFLDQVYDVSDTITVLRNGRLEGEYRAAELTRLSLVSKMLGRDASELEAKTGKAEEAAKGEVFLRARGITGQGVKGVDIEIRAGEVLGLAGLLGSGRTELAQLIFGVARAQAAAIEVRGEKAKISSPAKAIAKGMGFCPEDRRSAGIIPNLSVRENIIAAMQARRGWLRKLPLKKQRQIADEFIRALNIATTDAEKPVTHLSGGNQQKVILARWLAMKPGLLILDEPTRGIDVGAKAELEKNIAALRQQGMAMLFISSELEEVVRDSGRVAVMRDGGKIGELEGDSISLPAIIRMIAE